jgi:hypothetical protein
VGGGRLITASGLRRLLLLRSSLPLIVGLAAIAVAVGVLLPRAAPVGKPVAGLPVLTVSQALALRDAPFRGDRAFALSGLWSDGMVGHFCALVDRPLDGTDHCRQGEYGFTERNERAMEIAPHGEVVATAQGPYLQPWIISHPAGGVLYGPGMVGQNVPPVPVVVIGRFDDPQASICPAETLDECRRAFVVLAVASVKGEDRLPNIEERPAFDRGPLQANLDALERIVAEVRGPSETLLAAAVADGWNAGLLDRRIQGRLPGPIWFLTFLGPGGTLRITGVDEASGEVMWSG